MRLAVLTGRLSIWRKFCGRNKDFPAPDQRMRLIKKAGKINREGDDTRRLVQLFEYGEFS